MKNFFITLLVVCLVFSCGCNGRKKVEIESSKPTSSQQSNSAQIEADYSAAWVCYYDVPLPVSYINDDKQLLLNNDAEWQSDLYKRIGFSIKTDNTKVYDARQSYKGSAQNPYDNPLPSSYYNDEVTGSKLLIHGDWNPFPVKVRYENYTLDKQPDNKVWSDYFNAQIKKVSKTTPLVIKNAWFFDIDGDGKEESFVNASNTIISNDKLKQNPPQYEDTAIYTLSAYFKSDGTAVDMGGWIYKDISTSPINENKNIYYSYNPGKDIAQECYQLTKALDIDQTHRD